jgi:hypothetical protein
VTVERDVRAAMVAQQAAGVKQTLCAEQAPVGAEHWRATLGGATYVIADQAIDQLVPADPWNGYFLSSGW